MLFFLAIHCHRLNCYLNGMWNCVTYGLYSKLLLEKCVYVGAICYSGVVQSKGNIQLMQRRTHTHTFKCVFVCVCVCML